MFDAIQGLVGGKPRKGSEDLEALVETARGEQGDRPWVVVHKPRATKFKPQSQRLFDTFQAPANRGKSHP